jgi:hypothetical protein
MDELAGRCTHAAPDAFDCLNLLRREAGCKILSRRTCKHRGVEAALARIVQHAVHERTPAPRVHKID